MKFAEEDKEYFERREAFSKDSGPRELWSVIDQWPLYCGIANLGRYLAISDIFRETLNVPGDVAEFGSWKGANLMLLTKLLRLFDPHGGKTVHCFDGFIGLSEFVEEDGDAHKFKGEYQGELAEIERVIELYKLQDDVEFHIGLIENTLPKHVEERKEHSFSFIYCDTDLYESTRLILNHLHPRLSKGGIFALDEWNYKDYPGEGVAANEFLAQYGDCYDVRHIPNARQPTLVLKKIKY